MAKLLVLGLPLLVATLLSASPAQDRKVPDAAPGTLRAVGKSGLLCPLQGTDVKADVSGFGARVTVVQTFTNPSDQPIEAVYTFPLPAGAAVDRMRMQVGNRIVEGQIRRKEEAQAIYEAAKNRGQAAALLNQERPNIFTQSVANIMPRAQVKVEISYVELLKYEKGEFEFTFPMVVGPRYLGNAPDPEKISPPVAPAGTRAGSDIHLTVNLDAGAPVQAIESVLHQVRVDARSNSRFVVSLRNQSEIPNRDFILHYRMASNSVKSAFLAKYDPVKGGYFSLVLLPPRAPSQQQIAPREIIFVLDQSGSQNGFPMEKSKELAKKMLLAMRADDTFNVIGFSQILNPLWEGSRANTPQNVKEASDFISKLTATGGTELNNALQFAYKVKPDPNRLRLFVLNTDGFVGDESDILKFIRGHRGTSRMFTFGIGNSVNRYLIDAMSEEGKGDSEIVTLESSSKDAVARFMERTQTPVLLDVSARFSGVEISDVLPSQIPDVFGDKPVVIYGRYATPGAGKLTISGTMAGEPWSQTIDLMFPSDRPGGESIPTLWARRMVDKVEREYQLGVRPSTDSFEGKTKVTDLALEYGIMSQYTSFVAVEKRVVNVGGRQRVVHVPVDLASGLNPNMATDEQKAAAMPSMMMPTSPSGLTTGGGTAGGASGLAVAQLKGGQGIPPANGSGLSLATAKSPFVGNSKGGAPSKSDKKVEALRVKNAFEDKVAKPLRGARGRVDVEVWLDKCDDATLKALKKAGLKIDLTDKKLRLVLGQCDKKGLVKLAGIEAVRRIEPIS